MSQILLFDGPAVERVPKVGTLPSAADQKKGLAHDGRHRRGASRDGGQAGIVDQRGHGIGPEAGADEQDDQDDEHAAGDAVEADGRVVERLGPVHGLDRAEVIIEARRRRRR